MGTIVLNHLGRETGYIQRIQDFESHVAFRSGLIGIWLGFQLSAFHPIAGRVSKKCRNGLVYCQREPGWHPLQYGLGQSFTDKAMCFGSRPKRVVPL